jgi:transcription initiation factor TFIIB
LSGNIKKIGNSLYEYLYNLADELKNIKVLICLVKKERQKIEESTQCPQCGGTHLTRDYKRGELICEDCGFVIDEDFIDQGPEWRAFDSEQREKRARTGAPMTYTIHDKGLSTTIGWRNKDFYGKAIPTRNRAQVFRLRKWQQRIRIPGATERNLAIALSGLDRMASSLSLPRTVRETAAMVYRKAVTKNLIRGRSIESVSAAALYAACRRCDVPRTLNEIANISHMSRKDIGRTYRFVARELGLKLMPTSPQDYIPRFCSELKLSGNVQSKALEILKEAVDKELTSGRGPTGVAAAALYIASVLCGERRTQREVAEVAGVTEVTIRNRYKELAEKLDIGIVL